MRIIIVQIILACIGGIVGGYLAVLSVKKNNNF